MKFVATEEIAAPIEHVSSAVADFDRFEDMMGDRAKDLVRRPPGPPQKGTVWEGRATIRGKARKVKMQLVRLDDDGGMTIEGGTEGMNVTVDAQVEPMGPGRSRLTLTTEGKARTLSARLLLQTAKLARKTIAKRYKQGVADFASTVEKAYGPA